MGNGCSDVALVLPWFSFGNSLMKRKLACMCMSSILVDTNAVMGNRSDMQRRHAYNSETKVAQGLPPFSLY
jgi:hypothetical protein